jgi:peptide/nickel transport system ATP-binding protein
MTADPQTATRKAVRPGLGPILEMESLRLAYSVQGQPRETVRGVSFRIGRGEAYGLVGESGCGKSTVAFSAVDYLPDNVVRLGGRVLLDGKDVMSLSANEKRLLRKSVVSMVYQSAAAALNPTIQIGEQIAEVFRIHGYSRQEADTMSADALRKVKISDVDKVLGAYPHELSGGMQQRVIIAMAIAASPDLIILDEPTTGLDATVEAEILDLLESLRREFGVALLFISHNLAVVAKLCDRVGVLYAGRLVEEADARTLFVAPRHPYTASLLRCVPQWDARKQTGELATIPGFPPRAGAIVSGCVFADRCPLVEARCRAQQPIAETVGAGHSTWCFRHDDVTEMSAIGPECHDGAVDVAEFINEPRIIELRNLNKSYGKSSRRVRVLSDVSFSVHRGEVLGVVGESGSGKSTLAKVIVGLEPADAGSELSLMGTRLAERVQDRSLDQTRAIQMVFQDPGSSLNPKSRVDQVFRRAATKTLGLKGSDSGRYVHKIARHVHLDDIHIEARPDELSGGLKQRVAIGRAIAGKPQFIVCDEPTSALDVSVQAAIINLLVELQRTEGLSFIFVSHDLGIVRYISDRIMVLYLGRVMEIGPAEAVFSGPHHPYTEALLSAAPELDQDDIGEERVRLHGELPTHASPPSGCVFHTRCPRKLGAICETEVPRKQVDASGHEITCHIPMPNLGRSRRSETRTAGTAVPIAGKPSC